MAEQQEEFVMDLLLSIQPSGLVSTLLIIDGKEYRIDPISARRLASKINSYAEMAIAISAFFIASKNAGATTEECMQDSLQLAESIGRLRQAMASEVLQGNLQGAFMDATMERIRRYAEGSIVYGGGVGESPDADTDREADAVSEASMFARTGNTEPADSNEATEHGYDGRGSQGQPFGTNGQGGYQGAARGVGPDTRGGRGGSRDDGERDAPEFDERYWDWDSIKPN